MLTQGLVIDEPWIGHILAGRKIWEMRSKLTKKRGQVALIRKGSGLVVGTAKIFDCRSALTPETMQTYFENHQIPQSLVLSPNYKWLTPWVLTEIQPLDRAVRYQHPFGAVTFVNLSAEVVEEVVRQLRIANDVTTGPSNRPTDELWACATFPTEERRISGQQTDCLANSASKIESSSDANVKGSGRDRNHNTDNVKYDIKAIRTYRLSEWRELIGTVSALSAALCMLVFTAMIMIGGATSSMTFVYAFYALPPMFVFALIATITGHGDLLPNLFPEIRKRRGRRK